MCAGVLMLRWHGGISALDRCFSLLSWGVQVDGGEGRSSPGAGHGTSPSPLGSVSGGSWSLWFVFLGGGDLELHPLKGSHFVTALCGVILCAGQRGTGLGGKQLVRVSSAQRCPWRGRCSLAVALHHWHVPGEASWHPVATAGTGVDPWQPFCDSFPDPLFAVGDLQGALQLQEPVLGVLQPRKRAEAARRCDVCLPPRCAMLASALWPSRGGLSAVASPPQARGRQQLGLCQAMVQSRCRGSRGASPLQPMVPGVSRGCCRPHG